MRTVLRNLLIVTFTAVSMAACGPSPDELYQQGVEYYNNKDYSKAVECFTMAAKKGHEPSEKYLAMIFEGKPLETPAPVEETPAKPVAVDTVAVDTINMDLEVVNDSIAALDTIVEETPVVATKPVQPKKPAKPQAVEEQPVVEQPAPKPVRTTGVFSVSPTQKVCFSKGNLQYQASTKKWRFAEHQWDVLGNANNAIADNNSGWIDLYGWGTGKNPTKNSTNNKDYEGFFDWGKNSISNGGGSSWRTLTKEEWEYLLETRITPSGDRYAKATVNGVKGLILLPDNWNISYYGLDNYNKAGASFDGNVISKENWTNIIEPKGAIFIPLGGSRKGNTATGMNVDGYYWTVNSFDSSGAFAMYISDRALNSSKHYYHKNGFSVRLVRNAK